MASAKKTAKPRNEANEKIWDSRIEGDFDSGEGLYGGPEIDLPSNDSKVYKDGPYKGLPKLPESGADAPCLWCGAKDWEMTEEFDGLRRTSCCQAH